MPPKDKTRPRIPIVAPPPGVTMKLTSHAPGSQIYGLADLQLLLTGVRGCEHVALFLDNERYGDRMTPVGRNRFFVTIDTTEFEDGVHQILCAAIDKEGAILCSVASDLLFRNISTVNIISVQPTEAGSGFIIQLWLNTLRKKLDAERFGCVTRAEGENEELSCRVDYEGGVINNHTPIVTLYAERGDGTSIGSEPQQLRVLVKDNYGVVSAWTGRTYTAA